MGIKKHLKIVLSLIFIILALLGFWWYKHSSNQPINKQSTRSNDSLESYYEDSQKINSDQNKIAEVSFIAGGDIMLSRNVAGQISKNNKDANWPFQNLTSLLSSTDFNFANLESPYSGTDNFNSTESLVFNAPTWTLEGLLKNNFKVLNLANNHAMDQGLEGLLYTKKLLDDNQITNIGVGKNLDDAWQAKVYKIKGMNIGFIGASYSSINDNGATTNNYVARTNDLKRLKQQIESLKTKSDFIVVTMHSGTEYTRNPNEDQSTFAHTAIDAGADIVIGAHPHWIQTFEQYKGKYIFYSLGNFIFDQEWSQDTKEGLLLKVNVSNTGCENVMGQCGNNLQGTPNKSSLKQIELLPIIIEKYGQPRMATETEKQSIFKKIGATTNVITP